MEEGRITSKIEEDRLVAIEEEEPEDQIIFSQGKTGDSAMSSPQSCKPSSLNQHNFFWSSPVLNSSSTAAPTSLVPNSPISSSFSILPAPNPPTDSFNSTTNSHIDSVGPATNSPTGSIGHATNSPIVSIDPATSAHSYSSPVNSDNSATSVSSTPQRLVSLESLYNRGNWRLTKQRDEGRLEFGQSGEESRVG
ncbi:hypothetical protein U1Q18_020397 [Sarracenia purpurea var. burkii]